MKSKSKKSKEVTPDAPDLDAQETETPEPTQAQVIEEEKAPEPPKADYFSSSANKFPVGSQHEGNGHLCISCDEEITPDHLKHLSGGSVRYKLGWLRAPDGGFDARKHPRRHLVTTPAPAPSGFPKRQVVLNQVTDNFPSPGETGTVPVNFPEQPPQPAPEPEPVPVQDPMEHSDVVTVPEYKPEDIHSEVHES